MKNDRSDIFRFMAIRQADKLNDVNAARIKGYEESEDTSVLLTRFNEALQLDASAKAIEQIATDYVNNKLNGATTYTISLKELDSQLSEIDKKINSKSVYGSISFIKKELARLNITNETLADWKKRVGDSFNAALVLRENRGPELRSIENAIRTLHVMSLVKTEAIAHDKEIKKALTKTITVSKSVFRKVSSKEINRPDDKNAERIKENAERVKKAVGDYEDNSAAIKELSDAYDTDWEIRRLQQREERAPLPKAREIPAIYNGVLPRIGRWLGILPISEKIEIPARITPKRQSGLSEEVVKNISQETKNRLTAIGSNPDRIEASFAIMRLEEKNREIANDLNFSPGVRTTYLNRWGVKGVVPTTAGVHVDKGDIVRFPGECTFSANEPPLIDHLPNELGKYHTLNVGELHIIKQKLIGYEIGEIAHIENVMRSEERSRNHRTLHRTEEFTSFELEREEETERDLETTTRFELQKEINKEVQESTQKEAGLTVSGKYGPSVEYTANVNIATDKSSSNSNSLSNSYSKEVVDRSVQRIQEKIKEKRTLLTIDEVEVINEHKFINHGTATAPMAEIKHINGIYYWVNKKYEAQLFNYGTREIIEVVIPEPAAFIRYLATSHPKEGSTVNKPPKPGYCISGKFYPLSVGTLTETNYLDWVTAYNIQDIAPPPSSKTESAIFTSEGEEKSASDISKLAYKISFANKEMTIPPTYQAVEAWFSLGLIEQDFIQTETGPFSASDIFNGTDPADTTKPLITYGEIIIGRETLGVNSNSTSNPHHTLLNREEGKLAIAASIFSVLPINATVEVRFNRTQRSLQEWKISTFNSIMNRYDILKEEYEEAISGEDAFGGVDIQGKNPLENKDIILNELKRQAIRQMTGQDFGGFDAMRDMTPPPGFPQHDIDKAWSEGQYVRFVEQAFEWENMMYLFYPYFWGKKKDWPITSQLEDTDPLFKSFLQAGYCRLNIPIRPGFVNTTNTFLSTGVIPWDSKYDAPVVVTDPDDTEIGVEEEIGPFLSIAEEMKAKQGAVYFKTEGTVSHVPGDLDTVLTGDMVEDINEEGAVILDNNGNPVLIHGTEFTNDDVNREINLAGKIYMIISVNVEQQKITLDEDIAQPNLSKAHFGIGAKAIGVPWVVTIPTSLVILREGNELPEISE